DGVDAEGERRVRVPQRRGWHPGDRQGGAQAVEPDAGAGAVCGRRQDRELRRRRRAPAAAGDAHPRRRRRPVRRCRLRRSAAGAGLRLQGEAREGPVQVSVSGREKVLLSWSGGKDSAMALYELRRSARYEVVALLTTVASEFDRVSHHGGRVELLEQQSAAV